MVQPVPTRREVIGRVSLGAFLATAVAKDVPAATLAVGPVGATLPAGIYVVAHDLTIEQDLVLLPGARIDVASGVTLTLTGDFAAPAARIFPGAGRIDLNRSRALEARPEWWGAAPGDPARDSLAALEACVAAHPVTRLLAADYHIRGTWRIVLPNRAVQGMMGAAGGVGLMSRIVLDHPTADIVQVGPDANPGGPDRFVPGIQLRWLAFARQGAVRPPSAGQGARAAAGLRVQYCTASHFENLVSLESGIGYAMAGVVRSFFRNCSAYRSRAGTTRVNDIFYGFYLDGTVRIGLAGGNASLYMVECVASTPADAPIERSIGAYLPGAFADLFLIRLETAGMTHGIIADGGSVEHAAQRWGNGDLHIHMPILDNCGSTGIELVNLAPYALVDLVDPYIATRPGAWAALQVRDGGGQTTVAGGQLIGWADTGGTSIGINVLNAAGVAIRGVKLLGYRRPVQLAGASDFEVEVAINNPDEIARQAAVTVERSTRGTVRARVRGKRGAFPRGVELRGGTARVVIDCTGVDPECVSGAAILVAEGRTIAAPGPFGSNLASGLIG